MTALAPKPITVRPYPARRPRKGNIITKLLNTTDHKTIGLMYLVTSFAFFMVGGLMALLMRTELARPGLQFLSNEQYNQLLPCTARSCCCCTRPPPCSGSPTTSCRCRSARRTSPFPG